MKVKICGITNSEDALNCEQLGADALGFILYRGSKRFLSTDNLISVTKNLSPFTLKVGVFVNESPQIINSISKEARLNIVQLHGDETPEMIEKINLPVIKSFRIKSDFDFNLLNNFKNCSFLLDSYSPALYGGTGSTFNWDIIPEQIRSKIILSGGISIDNIHKIIREIKPAAIDVSSSLEEYPGKKNIKKILDFFTVMNKLK